MKLTEIRKPSERKLFEEFDKDNNTGFATEDLVQIYKQHTEGRWLPPVSAEQLLAEDEAEYQAWLAAGGKTE
jgi:hypothetical protein